MYGLEINRNHTLSVSKQILDQLRTSILNGKLTAGEKLPPTRVLAKDMGLARNTVIQVYEQLIAEGYLISTTGSGTFVTDIGKLPSRKETVGTPVKTGIPKRDGVISFNAGNPDASSFPWAKWAKLLKEACLEESASQNYCDYAGRIELRQVISSYVYRIKGIECDYNQIIITPGASGGMEILAKALKNRDKKIVIEDPSIHFVRNIFADCGYDIYPVDVDSQGMNIENLKKVPAADLIYVAPSHQYPIGGILPAARRISLLQYADEKDAYVIEDDYDSEFRYKGETLQALRNLAPERVIYIGSFSKIFSPSLRIGYMIPPYPLCGPIINQMELSNDWVNTTLQLALAEFINQKHLDKHIYQMKKIYENKRKRLMQCITDAFGNTVKISGENAGLHLLAGFPREFTEKDKEAVAREGLDMDFVEDYSIIKGNYKKELVLGYGELSYAQMEEGIRRLKKALKG